MSLETLIHLQDDEEIQLAVRRAGLTLLPRATFALFFILLPFFLLFPLIRSGQFGSAALAILFLIGIHQALKILFEWYFNVFVVTNLRVVDVHQKGILERTVADSTYDVIQDISYKKKGVLGMLANIGTMTVQTTGLGKNFEVQAVKNPHEVQELVNRMRVENRQKTPRAKKKLSEALEGMDEKTVDTLLKKVGEIKRKTAFEEFFDKDV